MTRPCSICGRPDRAAIDADLEGGLGLGAVASRYGVGKSALQRHRENHLGRAVTVRLPPTRPVASVSAPTSKPSGGHETGSSSPLPATSPYALDLPAEVSRLFDAAATSAEAHGIQAYAQVAFRALMEAYALALHARDPNVLSRVGRDLMRAVATHAQVPIDKLRQHAGWHEPPPPTQHHEDLQRLFLAQMLDLPEEIEAAEAELKAKRQILDDLGMKYEPSGPWEMTLERHREHMRQKARTTASTTYATDA